MFVRVEYWVCWKGNKGSKRHIRTFFCTGLVTVATAATDVVAMNATVLVSVGLTAKSASRAA